MNGMPIAVLSVERGRPAGPAPVAIGRKAGHTRPSNARSRDDGGRPYRFGVATGRERLALGDAWPNPARDAKTAGRSSRRSSSLFESGERSSFHPAMRRSWRITALPLLEVFDPSLDRSSPRRGHVNACALISVQNAASIRVTNIKFFETHGPLM